MLGNLLFIDLEATQDGKIFEIGLLCGNDGLKCESVKEAIDFIKNHKIDFVVGHNYVGFDKKIENVEHHSLFFDVDFDIHAEAIYDNPKWPEEPLFYASFPSKTDENCAPEGKEAGIFLIPLAPGLEDTKELRELYFEKIITRLEQLTDQKVKNNIIFKESFCVNDFIKDYNSYKGNAYGMANTLLQTAFLRPKLKSKKVKNLYFTGQLTVPGPGVPPSLISGKLVSDLIEKYQ